MSTQQDSTLTHVDIDSNPIFGTSNSPDLWNANEIWFHQLEIYRPTIPNDEKCYIMGLISRRPLILVTSAEEKQKVENQDLKYLIRSGEKLRFKKTLYEDQKKIKNLNRFCRFIMHLDQSRKSSKPDKFLIPVAKDKIDWERVEDPFRGIFMVRQGFTTLEKIYKHRKGLKLGSMINRFALTKSFSTGFSNANSNRDGVSNVLSSSSGSKTNDNISLPFEFWSISDRITLIILKIPSVKFNPDLDLQGLPDQIKRWHQSNKSPKIDLKLLGSKFIKRVISCKLFQSQRLLSVKDLTKRLDREMGGLNLGRLERLFLKCQYISKEYKKIPYLLGACYFYEANVHFTKALGQKVGLGYMEMYQKNDWMEHRTSSQIKNIDDRTDAEKELEVKLKYEFNDINLLRIVLSPSNTIRHERFEWLGNAVLEDSLTYALKDVLIKSSTMDASDSEALVYLNSISTLSTWVRRWLQPIKGLIENKNSQLDINKNRKAPLKSQASLVRALIGVMCIDCNGDLYPDSPLDIAIRGMFQEELKYVKKKYGI